LLSTNYRLTDNRLVPCRCISTYNVLIVTRNLRVWQPHGAKFCVKIVKVTCLVVVSYDRLSNIQCMT